MRLEAVCVAVDYADFLAETLPHLLPHVDDLVVVTARGDARTQALCRQQGVRCVATDCFYQGGDRFNKGRGINYGLMHLRKEGWVLQIDADIVPPPRTRWLLEQCCLEPQKVYGIDRVDIVGRQAWEDHKRTAPLQYAASYRIDAPRGRALGSRLAHMRYGGYVPIGFWQLFHPGGSGVTQYPDACADSAEHSDVAFGLNWRREDRVLLPEIIALHLVTRTRGPGLARGLDWRGRTSPEFSLTEGPYVRHLPALPGPAGYGA